jgi:hypothetical protein
MTVVFFVVEMVKLPITFCCRDSETTHHILWDCPSSLDVWSECGGKIQKRISEGGSFLELVENVMKSLQKRRYGVVCDGSNEDMETKKRGGSRETIHPPLRDSETGDGVASKIP